MDYDNIQALDDPERIFSLQGRVGLIAGGCGKMGQQFASILLRSGARLVLADASPKACDSASELLFKNHRDDLEVLQCDFSKPNDVSALFIDIDEKFGRLDFLIYNVMSKPMGYYRSFFNYSNETWNSVIQGNLGGAFSCCQEALKLMRRQKSGSVVLTSSIYSIVAPDQRIYDGCLPETNPYGKDEPLNLPGVYAAAKGGLNAFGRYLATLVADCNVRVNVLIPGGVFDNQEPEFYKSYIDRTPLKRMATWTDFNGAILFLVSDASRYMTGSMLVVDGGWSAW